MLHMKGVGAGWVRSRVLAHRAAVTVVFLSTLATPAATQITGAIPPAAPALRREVTVSSELVRIGDLVDNAGVSARIPIFRAPDLGQTGTVSAARILEAVRPHGLPIVVTGGISEVAVTRASRLISLKDIESRIADVLAGQSGLGQAKNLVVTIDRDARPVHLEPSANAELQATRVSYDPRSNRFDVTFDVAGSRAARRVSLRYVGTIVTMADVAVLTRGLNHGDVVKASDVAIARRPKGETPLDVLSSVADAVGLAARRSLRADEALSAADLVKPELVQRNETVTLIYAAPGLLLTVRAKALDSGTRGDTVSVLNVQSKRTVQGTVTGPAEVTITPPPRPTAQLDVPSSSQPESSQPEGEAPSQTK